jgi:hypothetical protein
MSGIPAAACLPGILSLEVAGPNHHDSLFVEAVGSLDSEASGSLELRVKEVVGSIWGFKASTGAKLATLRVVKGRIQEWTFGGALKSQTGVQTMKADYVD